MEEQKISAINVGYKRRNENFRILSTITETETHSMVSTAEWTLQRN